MKNIILVMKCMAVPLFALLLGFCDPGTGGLLKGPYAKELLGKSFSRSNPNGETIYKFTEKAIEISQQASSMTRTIEIRNLDNEKRRIIAQPVPKTGAGENAGQMMSQTYTIYFWQILENGNLKIILPRDNNKRSLEEAEGVGFPDAGTSVAIEFEPVN